MDSRDARKARRHLRRAQELLGFGSETRRTVLDEHMSTRKAIEIHKILYHGHVTTEHQFDSEPVIKFFTPDLRVAAYHAMYFTEFVGIPCISRYEVTQEIPYDRYDCLKDINCVLSDKNIENIEKAGTAFDIAAYEQLCRHTKRALYIPFDEDAFVIPIDQLDNLSFKDTVTWYRPEHIKLLVDNYRSVPPCGNVWITCEDGRLISKQLKLPPSLVSLRFVHAHKWLKEHWHKVTDYHTYKIIMSPSDARYTNSKSGRFFFSMPGYASTESVTPSENESGDRFHIHASEAVKFFPPAHLKEGNWTNVFVEYDLSNDMKLFDFKLETFMDDLKKVNNNEYMPMCKIHNVFSHLKTHFCPS